MTSSPPPTTSSSATTSHVIDVYLRAPLGSSNELPQVDASAWTSGGHDDTRDPTTTTAAEEKQHDAVLDEIWAAARRKKIKADEMMKSTLRGASTRSLQTEGDGITLHHPGTMVMDQQHNTSSSSTSAGQGEIDAQGDRERERKERERIQQMMNESIQWE